MNFGYLYSSVRKDRNVDLVHKLFIFVVKYSFSTYLYLVTGFTKLGGRRLHIFVVLHNFHNFIGR